MHQRTEGLPAPHEAAGRRRRLIFFVMLDAAFVLLVVVPALIYLFVLDNGLSERDLMLYVVGIVSLQAAVTGLLLWKLRIIPGPRTDKKDAR
jgi:hypothetical protein